MVCQTYPVAVIDFMLSLYLQVLFVSYVGAIVVELELKSRKGGKRREKAEKADLVMQLAFWQTLQQLDSS